MRPYTVLQHHVVRLPPVCAWCGRRPDAHMREAVLTCSFLWTQLHLRLTLPICSLCEAYVEALQRAEVRLRRWLVVLWAPVSALLIRLWLGPPGDLGDWIAFAGGSAVLTLALVAGSRWLMGRTGLHRRILRAMVGEPPEGYASETDAPAAWDGAEDLRFHSADYRQQLAELDSEQWSVVSG